MEIFLTILFYIVVFGSAAVVAGLLAVAVWYILKKQMSKLWCYFGCLVAVLVMLAGLSREPLLFYGRDCPQSLSDKQEAAVRAVSSGVYSSRLPLVLVAIRTDYADEDYAAWTEFYFPCGTMEMELSGTDGYNCRKYLLPW